jgi:nitrite reductase/ring-hydroxylating ferredoxin subunit
MTSLESTELLNAVGPGTPLGDLLRRYWQPFFIAADLTDARPIRPTKILSETLVLFRDRLGRVGLIQERCAHGGYPMIYASIDGHSIACARHGWHFDIDGNCWVVGYQDKEYAMGWAHAHTYPVRQYAGLLWTYLGPEPAPALPRIDVLARTDGRRRIRTFANEKANVFDRGAAGSLILPTHLSADGLWLRTPMDEELTWSVLVEFVAGEGSDPATEVPDVAAGTLSPLDSNEPNGTRHERANIAEMLGLEIERMNAGLDPTGVARGVDEPLIVTGLI